MCLNFFKSLLGICSTRPLDPNLWSFEDGKIQLKPGDVTELSAEGGAVYLTGSGLPNPVLIVKAENENYLAFDNRCPHGKRKIDPVPGQHTLRCCSVNHSTFDYEGNRIKGPAKGALTSYTVEVSDENLIITL